MANILSFLPSLKSPREFYGSSRGASGEKDHHWILELCYLEPKVKYQTIYCPFKAVRSIRLQDWLLKLSFFTAYLWPVESLLHLFQQPPESSNIKKSNHLWTSPNISYISLVGLNHCKDDLPTVLDNCEPCLAPCKEYFLQQVHRPRCKGWQRGDAEPNKGVGRQTIQQHRPPNSQAIDT